MAVDRKYERDIDLLLAEEFEVSPLFASWFLGRTKKFAGVPANVLKVWVSKSDRNGESDLVVLFEGVGNDRRFALHIEDKVNAPLQPEQVARYRIRADGEVRNKEYSDYEVVLCSPEGYCPEHREQMSFDSFVSYEDIGGFLKPSDPKDRRGNYRANFVLTATTRTGNTWKIERDPLTDKFWQAACQIANREFPDLEMKPPKLTKGSNWIVFRPLDLPTHPKWIYVSLKGDRGFVDLTFTDSLQRLFSPRVRPFLEDGMEIHQTGKSAAIRIEVVGFEVADPDEAAMSKVRAAFAACVKLIRFYRQNRAALDRAASESIPDPVHSY
jgi:hypothetical protein